MGIKSRGMPFISRNFFAKGRVGRHFKTVKNTLEKSDLFWHILGLIIWLAYEQH